MPTFNTKDLLTALEADVQATLRRIEEIKHFDSATLNKQPAAGKWSPAQVIEHLNSYNRYYLPGIGKALSSSKPVRHNPVFRAGLFGNYFTNMMLPKAGGKVANKMNAPKDHRPQASLNSTEVIEEFIRGQQQLIAFLHQAATTDIGKIKVPISISRFIKLKLGDTFRFLIAHQQRHFIQLNNALTVVGPGRASAAVRA